MMRVKRLKDEQYEKVKPKSNSLNWLSDYIFLGLNPNRVHLTFRVIRLDRVEWHESSRSGSIYIILSWEEWISSTKRFINSVAYIMVDECNEWDTRSTWRRQLIVTPLNSQFVPVSCLLALAIAFLCFCPFAHPITPCAVLTPWLTPSTWQGLTSEATLDAKKIIIN